MKSLIFASLVFFVGVALAQSDLEQDTEQDTFEVAQRDVRPSGRKTAPNPAPTATPTQENLPPSVQEDYFEQIRNLSGRVDTVENQVNTLYSLQSGEKDAVSKERQALEQKFVAYEEELKKLEAQVAALSEEVTKLKAEGAGKSSSGDKAEKGTGKKNSKTAYDEGEQLFSQKKFKEAILAYQKYRDNNPKGKLYADATYKMGVCFQEVGLKDEAKVFFEEVVNKYAGSKESKKAAFRLKQLK